MPDIIQFKNGNQICNLYDAGGRKLRTEYSTLGTPVIVPVGSIGSAGDPTNCSDYIYGTEYMDNFEYGFENDCGNYVMYLDKIYNSEGYAMGLYNNYPYWYSALNYNYYRKDHLGNIREVWQAPPSEPVPIYREGGGAGFTSQRTQYYPSGLPWAEGEGQEVQNKKYNGKEWIEAHGLDEYDSQARMYYPAIMRTTTIDPLAEKYYSISPYAWCGNNPVNAIDPFGMDVWTTSDPNVIKQVMRDYNNGCSATIGGNRWAHFTDNQFRNGLNYDDKKGTYSFMYGTYNRYKDGSAGNFTTHLMKLPYIPGHLESWGKSDPNSLFAPDGTYNLYTRNEDKAAMAFYAGIAGGELFSAAAGIIWANRARIALGTINTTIKAVNIGEKAIQTANTAAYVVGNSMKRPIYGVTIGTAEGIWNFLSPPDASINYTNTPLSQTVSGLTTYLGMPFAQYLLRTYNNQNINTTKK